MLGTDGARGIRGRDVLLGGLSLAVVLAVGFAIRGGSGGGDQASGSVTAEDEASSDTTERSRLVPVDHDPGDCVTWDEGESYLTETRVVGCDVPHRIQVFGEVLMPYAEEYPSPEAWRAIETDECAAIVTEHLGHPLDPYGRFVVSSLVPSPETWAESERTVQCGVRGWEHVGDGLVSGDIRTSELTFRFEVGACLSVGVTWPPTVVPCEQPHHREITGHVELGDFSAAPSGDDLTGRCLPVTVDYIGTAGMGVWRSGVDPMSAESWAAGTRVVHCFAMQVDAGGTPIAVTGSAKG